MGTEENNLTKEIMAYLTVKQIYHWRNNTGRRGTVSYGFPGSADILGLLPSGRFLGIEVKSPEGLQNDKQMEFESNINVNNGIYLLARCLEDVSEYIN